MARRIYSLQFKQEAVAMARQSDASVRSVAKGLGIRPQTLEYWIEHPPAATRREKASELQSDDPAALTLRLREAEARNQRLEMEKQILKKATAFFASQSR
jgi:transposase